MKLRPREVALWSRVYGTTYGAEITRKRMSGWDITVYVPTEPHQAHAIAEQAANEAVAALRKAFK